MWKQCIESREIVSQRLGEANDILEFLDESVPQNYNDTAQLVDKCKNAGSTLDTCLQQF